MNLLQTTEVPAPQTDYYLPGGDKLFAELAWPDTSPPVAILFGEQQAYLDEWKSRGWKVPGSGLTEEKIVKGVKHYTCTNPKIEPADHRRDTH